MSAPYIPEDIGRRALGLRDADTPATDEQAGRIADRIMTAADRVGMSVPEYVRERARRLNVSPENPDVKSAFWSFEVPHPDLPPGKALSNMYIAEAWAETENEKVPGSARYLEGTRGGRALGNLRLWDTAVHRELNLQGDEGWDLAKSAWSTLSQRYAEAAKGEVVVFAQTAFPGTVLQTTELPALRTNPDVGLDNIKFAYAAPDGWPPVAREELGTDAVRAQAQFALPDKPLHVDPAEYAAKPAAERTAVLGKLSADVAEADASHVRITPLTAGAERAGVAQEGGKEAGPSGPTAPTPVWQMGFTPRPTAAAKGTSAAPVAAPEPAGPGVGKAVTGTGLG